MLRVHSKLFIYLSSLTAFNPVISLQLTYTVATTRSEDVPAFGPSLPAAEAQFDAVAIHDGRFTAFLLAKIINAENAAYHCEALHKLSSRTRATMLSTVVSSYNSDVLVSGAPRAKESVIASFIRRSKSVRAMSSSKLGALSNLNMDLSGFGSKVSEMMAALGDMRDMRCLF